MQAPAAFAVANGSNEDDDEPVVLRAELRGYQGAKTLSVRARVPLLGPRLDPL